MHGAGPASRPAGDQNDRSAAGPAGDGLASSTCFARCPRLRGEYLPTPLPLWVRVPKMALVWWRFRETRVMAEGGGLETPKGCLPNFGRAPSRRAIAPET